MTDAQIDNRSYQLLAETLDEIAELLSAVEDNPFRVRAYRRAAQTIRERPEEMLSLYLKGGSEALEALENIGPGIAARIEEWTRTGRLRVLERLREEVGPEEVFATIPGVGEELSARIRDELGIVTLEELEVAAHNGRLDAVPGFGPERVKAVRRTLDSMLKRASSLSSHGVSASEASSHDGVMDAPSVESLLTIDARYRDLAERGELRRIAPRRFNPKRRKWLPIFEETVDGLDVTALFSNTARAHRLGRTDDWVVIHYRAPDLLGSCTVVTETSGPLQGKRVVRGREQECRTYYEHGASRPDSAADDHRNMRGSA